MIENSIANSVEHTGVVEKVADGRITISVALDGCASCGHGSSCGMAALTRQQSVTRMEFAAPPGMQAGDTVTLSMPASGMGRFALLGYLLPALALVIGAALGSAIGGSDAGTALGALLGFVIAMFAARLLTRRLPTPMILTNPSPSFSSSSPSSPSSPSHSNGVSS